MELTVKHMQLTVVAETCHPKQALPIDFIDQSSDLSSQVTDKQKKVDPMFDSLKSAANRCSSCSCVSSLNELTPLLNSKLMIPNEALIIR